MTQPLKGRGTSHNPANRFDEMYFKPELEEDFLGEESPLPGTHFFKDHSKSIVSENKSPDVGFDVSVNPYRGCEHGCVYCYARPTHEYLGFSAGLDFETKIMVKEEAATLLREKLLKKSWEPRVINFSGVTDCYQPVERKLKITRSCLEVLLEFKNPFTIITKNQLVTRDLDILIPMAKSQGVAVFISVTTLNPELASLMEPRTSVPAARLKTVAALREAGVPVGVMVAPIIPGLTDHEIPSILKAVSMAGAQFAGFVPLRLPYGLDELFTKWLTDHFPDRKEKVLNRIREIRGGKLNNSDFKSRMRGEGVYAEQMLSMFRLHAAKYGLNQRLNLTTEFFVRPKAQMELL